MDFAKTITGEPPELPLGTPSGLGGLFVARQHHGLPVQGHIGRYELKYRIGEGSQGGVYEAFDPVLSRTLAIKTLHVDLSQEDRARFDVVFLDEARTAAKLNHPHIVTVFDAGVSAYGPYIAMELLTGRDLGSLLKEGRRPSVTETAHIIRRVADAIAYAHSRGVIHHDIKPANIFMAGPTQPKVLDFGIAELMAHQPVHPEGSEGQALVGSPYYMAPERLRGEAVDHRSDVFSLGVVLYELLTGERPFTGSTLEEIERAIRSHHPHPVHDANVRVPLELSRIAGKAMAKDPEDRYESAAAFSRDLRHWLASLRDTRRQRRQTIQKRRIVAGALLGVIAFGVIASLSWWVLQDTATEASASAATDSVATGGAVAAATRSPEAVPVPTPGPAAAPAAPAAQDAGIGRTVTEPSSAQPATRSAKALPMAPTGSVTLAVSPWGVVEVDGVKRGIVPPLNELKLSEGSHTITIRNGNFPPYTAKITVAAGKPVKIKHRFGSKS